ncbi:hypothetical protein CUZ56_00908 [Saezia sanguinis]|uniref:Uncharacterized protein n=1 Tax=Saezia sanguinis TaxID=1965230 RepID=A0A433SDZ2_9BURK|nr:hypothetical protein [Saezia sanguinis]RUS66971.1 hypothetical protein CUZ56_00908 [Saezia sanguinis]
MATAPDLLQVHGYFHATLYFRFPYLQYQLMKNKFLGAICVLAVLSIACWVLGRSFGWIGILAIVFLFVILCGFQLYSTVKLISTINHAPEGYTANASRLVQQIRIGMPLVKVVQTAQALGKKTSTQPDTYIWQDAHHRVIVTVENQKAAHIELQPVEPATPTPSTPFL